MLCNLTQREKELVQAIYGVIVQKAFTSGAAATITKLYPEAFIKERK